MRPSLLHLLLLIAVLVLLAQPAVAQEDDDEVSEDDEIIEEDDEDVFIPSSSTYYTSPSSERAKLIITKRMITPVLGLFGINRPIDVSIMVTNVGTAPAYAVEIKDNFGDLFEIIKGTNTSSVDVLDVHERAYLNFTIVPRQEGMFSGGAASVSYQGEGEGSRLQQAYSTDFRSFQIYNENVFDNYARDRTTEWTIFIIGVLAAIVLPLGLFLQLVYLQPSKGAKSKSSKKRR